MKRITNLKEKIKTHFRDLLKNKQGVHNIALGFAIGSFITILPTPGLNIIFGLIILLTFKSISRYALFTSFFVFNGFVKSFIYIGSYWLGSIFFNTGSKIIFDGNWVRTSVEITQKFFVGILITDIIISIASYYIVKKIVKTYRKNKSVLTE